MANCKKLIIMLLLAAISQNIVAMEPTAATVDPQTIYPFARVGRHGEHLTPQETTLLRDIWQYAKGAATATYKREINRKASWASAGISLLACFASIYKCAQFSIPPVPLENFLTCITIPLCTPITTYLVCKSLFKKCLGFLLPLCSKNARDITQTRNQLIARGKTLRGTEQGPNIGSLYIPVNKLNRIKDVTDQEHFSNVDNVPFELLLFRGYYYHWHDHDHRPIGINPLRTAILGDEATSLNTLFNPGCREMMKTIRQIEDKPKENNLVRKLFTISKISAPVLAPIAVTALALKLLSLARILSITIG